MIVHKFGGTSVGSPDRFSCVADILTSQDSKSSSSNGLSQRVVVVSAMNGVTDQLIQGARAAAEKNDSLHREIKANLLHKHLEVAETQLKNSPERLEIGGLIEDRLHDLERLYRSIAVLGELTVRSRDAVASIGEQLSANILSAVLRERDVRSKAISAVELIVTDGNFGAARPLLDKTKQQIHKKLYPLLERGIVPVITGYIAATEDGIPTTLGRGGSDFTAAIIGACLQVDEVWIWSDVDGILTADPNLVPNARTLSELSYSEAADLAYYGAEVLHPKTIQPLIESGIPLRLLNSFNPTHQGTLIVQEPDSDRENLPAIISTTGYSLIAAGSPDDSWTLYDAARALQRLSEAGLDVPMFSQSFSEHTLNLVVREQDQTHILHILRRELGEDFHLGTKEKVATVSVVGVPDWNETGILSHTFAALGKLDTRVIAVAQAATEYSVSFCIPAEQLADTVRFLHKEFGLENGHKTKTNHA